MENETIKTGIIYCRVSSKEQVDGTSLESQERLAREYATREGIEVLKAFIEKGESAKTADRTEFTKAINFCTEKKSRVGYFIVYKLDRFARNQEDHVTVQAILKKAGIKLRSVTEPINDSAVGKVFESMLSAFAEFDNNMRTERSRQGMEERLKQGVWVWQAPLGYRRAYQGANISPDPETALLIRLAFEEYAKGIYTYEKLADFLFERGLKTKNGKKPSPQLMEKILKNKIYCGVIDTWGQYEGTFEAIIPKELFNKCQKGTAEGFHASPRSANNPMFPLRGVLICEGCKTPLTGSASVGRKGKKYPYYHHPSQKCD